MKEIWIMEVLSLTNCYNVWWTTIQIVIEKCVCLQHDYFSYRWYMWEQKNTREEFEGRSFLFTCQVQSYPSQITISQTAYLTYSNWYSFSPCSSVRKCQLLLAIITAKKMDSNFFVGQLWVQKILLNKSTFILPRILFWKRVVLLLWNQKESKDTALETKNWHKVICHNRVTIDYKFIADYI